MKSISEATNQEQLDDLSWASLFLIGTLGATDGNVNAAINMVKVIAKRGEPKAKVVANLMLNSYQVKALLERIRTGSAITGFVKQQAA